MPDPGKRISNWDDKFNVERVSAILTEKRPTMLQNVSTSFTSIALMETQVKQVCDGAGVATIMYPYYLCFGREMWSLARREFSGESLAIEAATLIEKWKTRGLTEAVLQAIRTDVFSVAAPLGP